MSLSVPLSFLMVPPIFAYSYLMGFPLVSPLGFLLVPPTFPLSFQMGSPLIYIGVPTRFRMVSHILRLIFIMVSLLLPLGLPIGTPYFST